MEVHITIDMYNYLYTYMYIHIYIYMYVCVCVRVTEHVEYESPSRYTDSPLRAFEGELGVPWTQSSRELLGGKAP